MFSSAFAELIQTKTINDHSDNFLQAPVPPFLPLSSAAKRTATGLLWRGA
jgi:hypothetical protein